MTGLPYRAAVSHGRAKRLIRETLTHTEWANELHPKPRGFNKVGRVCWGPAFAVAGLR